MSKLNERLTLVANLSVVAGVVFLAAEMRQNTQAIQAQTRDAMTEKQMMWLEWVGTDPEVAAVFTTGTADGAASLEGPHRMMYRFLALGNLREWENSHYQHEKGLFTEDEFGARLNAWAGIMRSSLGYREVWAGSREDFSPSFRAEIDRIVAEVAQAQ